MAKRSLMQISSTEREKLEAWLVDFDRSWQEDAMAVWAKRLPELSTSLRRAALVEMAKVDLERQWQRGRRVDVETYLEQYPDLGTAETVPPDLVHAEYQVRRQFGAPADLADFAKRFPNQGQEVRRLSERAQSMQTDPAPPVAKRLPKDQTDTSRPSTSTQTDVALRRIPERLPVEFGRYRILQKLGEGGMGAVYLAHDSQLDRQVALKVPSFSAKDGPQIIERFHREARSAATLSHPNICPIHDVGRIDGTHYLTMAYIQGRTLADFIRPGKSLPEKQVAAVVRKLALALQEAHEHGVIHRDLKPSNVMIDHRHEPVVMDFGLAYRSGAEGSHMTQSGAILGTPAYMSPEQAMGESKKIGPQSDVYSLGVILYQLLAGRLPFEGPPTAVIGQILTVEAEPPEKDRPDLSPQLSAICRRAMAKRTEERYASMQAFASVLGEYLHGPMHRVGKTPVALPPPRPAEVVPAVADDRSEYGQLFAELASVAAAQPAAKPLGKVSSRTRRRVPRGLAIGAALGLLSVLVLLAIVFKLKTSDGTLVVELTDPDVTVEVLDEEGTVQIRRPGEKGSMTIGVEPGGHRLRIQKDGLDVYAKEFSMAAAGREVVRASWVPKKDPASEKVPRDQKLEGAAVTSRPGDAQPQSPLQPPPPDPRRVAERRQQYLDRFLNSLPTAKAEEIPATRYAASFPPNRPTQFVMDTTGMTAQCYVDWECTRPLDSERVAQGKSAYFKGYLDAQNRLRQVESYGQDGGLAEGPMGCAISRYWHDQKGRLAQEAFFGMDRKPGENRHLVVAAHHTYDGESQHRAETRFFGTDGIPAEDFLGVHRRVYREGKVSLEYRLDGTHRERWLPAFNLGTRFNQDEAWQPSMTPDGKEMYFASGFTGFSQTARQGIFRITWQGDHWSDPEQVLVGGRPLKGMHPAISSDGRLLAVVAWGSIPHALPQYPELPNYSMADIYITERKDGVWQPVRNAGAKVNAKNEEAGVCFLPESHKLCLTANLPELPHTLWLSDREGNEWGAPRAMPVGLAEARAPTFAEGGRQLYLESHKGYGGGDIWMTKQEGQRWSRPINLGPEVNHGWHDSSPTSTADGSIVYFCRCCSWNLYVTGRADSERTIRHLADVFAWSDCDLPLTVVEAGGPEKLIPVPAPLPSGSEKHSTADKPS